MADASPHNLPWMFGIPDPWLIATSFEEADATLAEAGMRHMMYMTVMDATALEDPIRPLPKQIESPVCRTPPRPLMLSI